MNTISSKQILSRVFRLLKPVDAHWVTDALDSIDEAVQALGTNAFGVYEEKIKATNFRAPLPCNLEYINHITVNGERVFHNSEIGIFSDVGNSVTTEGYRLEPGYLKTPQATCHVVINFAAIPRDEEGLPLIPKSYEVTEAIFWYVVSHMILGGYEPKVQGINYESAERRWHEYRGTAVNELMMPTPDEYETTSRMWLGQKDVDIYTLHNKLRFYPQTTP